MNILIDAHVFDGKYQGTRTYIKGLYNELIKRNPQWKFYFVSRNKNNLITQFPDVNNVYFIEFRLSRRIFNLLVEIPYLILKHKIDFTHFQYISPFVKFGKFIVTNHDILFEEPRFKSYFPSFYRYTKSLLFRFSAKQADVLLTVSKYSKVMIHDIYGIPKSSIGITTNAVETTSKRVDQNIRSEIKNLTKRKYLLYVSRIEPRKNHISVLKAFVNLNLHKKGYHIVFVGNYDIKSIEFDTFVESNSIIFNSHLFMYDKVNDSELFELYNNTELVLYPSVAEGFGIPPLEGAMYNKKVLCSNATAMLEFDFFPYHVNPINQKEIEKSIIEVLVDNNYPHEKVKKTILEKYTWEKSAIEYEIMILKKTKN